MRTLWFPTSRLRITMAAAIFGAAVFCFASAIPVQAQHSGGGGSAHAGGGSSGGGHSAGGFSGGGAPHISSAPSAPSGYSSAPHYTSAPTGYASPTHYAGGPGARPTYVPRGLPAHPPTTSHYGTSQPTHSTSTTHSGTPRTGGPAIRTSYPGHGNTGGNHSGNNGHNGGYGNGWRRGYNGYRYNGLGFPYGGYFGPVYNPWLFYPWLDADLSWDYWHDTGDSNDAIAAASVGADAYGSAPPDGGGDAGAVADNAQPQSDAENEAQMQAEAQAQEDAQYDAYRSGGSAIQGESTNPGMTLVYKNGQQQLIDNYVVSSSAVTITDRAGHITTIPTSALNIVATNQANAALGNGLVLTTR